MIHCFTFEQNQIILSHTAIIAEVVPCMLKQWPALCKFYMPYITASS